MAEIHETFAWVVIAVTGVVGLWAMAAHWVPGVRTAWMWRAAALSHLLVGVQVALGAYLVSQTEREASDIHMFYGFLTLVGVAIIVSYRHLEQYRYLIYGAGGLFIMGLGLRAATLDPFA